jgi:hypothetical protein
MNRTTVRDITQRAEAYERGFVNGWNKAMKNG